MIRHGKDHGYFKIRGFNYLEIKNLLKFSCFSSEEAAQSAPTLNPVMCE